MCLEQWEKDPRPKEDMALPYRYIAATGIIALFVGIGMVILGGEKL